MHRVAYLIDSGVDPSQILLLTFTRKSSEEMLERVGALIGSRFARMRITTLRAHIAAGLGSFAVAIAGSAIFVAVLLWTTHVRFADIVGAFAPGAMDAMLALALTLHIDPIFVGAHHLSRFVFVSITTPGIVHLFGRPQDDVDD